MLSFLFQLLVLLLPNLEIQQPLHPALNKWKELQNQHHQVLVVLGNAQFVLYQIIKNEPIVLHVNRKNLNHLLLPFYRYKQLRKQVQLIIIFNLIFSIIYIALHEPTKHHYYFKAICLTWDENVTSFFSQIICLRPRLFYNIYSNFLKLYPSAHFQNQTKNIQGLSSHCVYQFQSSFLPK